MPLETHLGTREEMRRCRPGPPFLLTSAERDQSRAGGRAAGLTAADRWGSAATERLGKEQNTRDIVPQ